MSESSVAMLQALLIETIMNNGMLPGMERSLDFPDLEAWRNSEHHYVSTEHLADPDALSSVFERIGADQIRDVAQQGGVFPYLRFQEPKVEEGRVQLSVQLLTGFEDVEPLPLGAVVAQFAQRDGDWFAIDPTHVLAY